jgi:hypothetical protein
LCCFGTFFTVFGTFFTVFGTFFTVFGTFFTVFGTFFTVFGITYQQKSGNPGVKTKSIASVTRLGEISPFGEKSSQLYLYILNFYILTNIQYVGNFKKIL